MKILHIILTDEFAGSERYAAELANASAERHEVVIVARHPRHRDRGTIHTHIGSKVRVIELPRYLQMMQLRRILARERPDLIHCHLGRASRMCGKIAAGYPRVATLHITYKPRDYVRLDGLIAISPRQLPQIPPDFAGEIVQLPVPFKHSPRLSAADVAALRAQLGVPAGHRVIGAVGRLNHYKGFDVLIDAFARAGLAGTTLLIVGSGPEQAALAAQAAAANCGIVMTGFRDDVSAVFQTFDLFVSPARDEPSGMVFLEAMEAQLPIVATRSRGALEWAKEFPIKLCDCDNTESLTEALRQAQDASKPVAYDISRFEIGTLARDVERFYSQVIDARQKAGSRPSSLRASARPLPD